VLVISHDRYFLDRVATKILALEGGRGTLHSGNYTDLRERLAAAAKPAAPPKPQPPPRSEAPAPKRAHPRGTSRDAGRELERRRRRLRNLEEDIAACEAEVGRLAAALLGDPGGDWQKLHSLVAEKETAEARLGQLMTKWQEQSEKLDSEIGRSTGEEG
jgi:hypothetical protein